MDSAGAVPADDQFTPLIDVWTLKEVVPMALFVHVKVICEGPVPIPRRSGWGQQLDAVTTLDTRASTPSCYRP